ncbi:hypothetical protein LRC537489_22330 [Mycobacterium riyadhense]
MYAARSRLRYAVEDAQAAGFAVGEDLSVADRSTGGAAAVPARQAQAEAFSVDIAQRAAQLVELDQQVAGKISAALTGIADISFDNAAPVSPTPTPTGHNGIQLVDWKQTPEPKLPPGPTAQDIRGAIKDLPQGTKPSFLEVRSEEGLREFWEWLSRDAREYTSTKPYRGGTGIERQLSDGTIVRIGESSNHGSTMDRTLPNNEHVKLHVNTARGGELNFPKASRIDTAPGPTATQSSPSASARQRRTAGPSRI